MAQHSNEHLTIAQLSAYVDKELAPDELALCDAHLRTCQLCRSALADLQLTSALLRGMPQERAPRSIVLPLNIAVLPETPTHEDQLSRRPARRRQYVLRRTLRALSTLAAVIGLVFILIGAISALPHGGGVANMSTASSGVPAAAPARHPTSTSSASGTRPSIQDTHSTSAVEKTPTPTPTPAPSPAVTQRTPSYASTNQTAEPPPAVLDLGRPEGRLSIGSALFLLGLLGVILARRHQKGV